RAIRVRSHSMETMVGSQKKHQPGGIPGSLSGGIVHNTSVGSSNSQESIKESYKEAIRLISPFAHWIRKPSRTPEPMSEASSNPSSPEICPNKESTSSFSSTAGESENMEEYESLGSQSSTASPYKQDVFVYSPSQSIENPNLASASTPVIMSRSPTADIKSRNSPRSNLKFRFDKLSHSSSGP
ncbi:hypothetical protein E2320_018309, partial [Naja naja]